MSDIPIIMSGPMVRALLEGQKTMTRRLAWRDAEFGLQDYASEQLEEMDAKGWNVVGEGNEGMFRVYKPSPWQRVKPGDRLWVRESFFLADAYLAAKKFTGGCYKADETNPLALKHTGWRPSIHMPRWASRLTLIVTATKIEPLLDISDVDAKAEGVVEDDGSEPDIWYVPGAAEAGWKIQMAIRPASVFKSLWAALHGCAALAANPEVVALSFTVHKQNIDTLAEAA